MKLWFTKIRNPSLLSLYSVGKLILILYLKVDITSDCQCKLVIIGLCDIIKINHSWIFLEMDIILQIITIIILIT